MKQVVTILLLSLTFISSFMRPIYAAPPAADIFDIDGDGETKSLTDAVIFMRYLFNFRGESLINKAIGDGATRKEASEIEKHINDHLDQMDIDDNGKVEPLSDGLLLMRYLFDFQGEFLVKEAIGDGAKRVSSDQVINYIRFLTGLSDFKGWDVPFLYQKNYRYIDEAAGAATSLAMILQFYYPDSLIDPRVVFHSGLQHYLYVFGSADSYRNVRGDIKKGSLLTEHVPAEGRVFYFQSSTGATRANIDTYLDHSWGIKTKTITTLDEVYDVIKKGPVLLHVNGQGFSGIYSDNHYIILTGIDDNSTPADKSDDYLIVNDPYNSGGEFMRIPSAEFSSKWFVNGVKFNFSDSESQRLHTVLVDTGHNSTSGVSTTHKFELENFSAWTFAYLNGDWYYHTGSALLSATWKPKIQSAGYYRVTTTVKGEDRANSIVYILYNNNGVEVERKLVNHRDRDRRWLTNIIFSDVYIQDGYFVKAINIPHSTNIDGLKFQYLRN